MRIVDQVSLGLADSGALELVARPLPDAARVSVCVSVVLTLLLLLQHACKGRLTRAPVVYTDARKKVS